MKIFKYLFLLLLLSTFTLTVFFATQKGDFEVSRSIIIKTPKVTLYNYINEYKNWDFFYNPSQSNQNISFTFSPKSFGLNSFLSWNSNSNYGTVKTLKLKENQTIEQIIDIDNYKIYSDWTFKDTIGGTKITWKNKGVMPFGQKLYVLLNGGASKVLGKELDKSLKNINKSLHQELSNYSIEVNGQVTKLGTNYVYYPINSKITNITKNYRIVVPKIEKFIKENELESKGKPYILFNKYDTTNNFTNFFVCIDLKETFVVGPQSEILTGKSEDFQAIKTTLTGDYSHFDEVYSKIDDYLIQTKRKQDTLKPFIEMYLKSLHEEKKSSHWKTVFYTPILIPKKVVKPVYVPETRPERRVIVPVSDISQQKPKENDVEKSIVIPDLKRPQ